MSQARGNQSHYIALGNEVTVNNFDAFFDVMYMREGIDREGIVSSIVGNNANGGHRNDAEYLSLVLKAQYRFAPKWNVFVKGMLENQGLSKDNGTVEKGKYRTALGYLAGLEYYPMKNSNLHFFLTYVGRHYSYTDRAKAYGFDDYSTNRISLGYIWQLPMF
jgi:hypothetical protein